MDYTAAEAKRRAGLWRARAQIAYTAAQRAYEASDWHTTANRAYYAVYQLCTAVCIEHGDASQFPSVWNNPAHEQLPDLIRNNGDITVYARRQVSGLLYSLRSAREDADYRIGRTVNKETADDCLKESRRIFDYLDTTAKG